MMKTEYLRRFSFPKNLIHLWQKSFCFQEKSIKIRKESFCCKKNLARFFERVKCPSPESIKDAITFDGVQFKHNIYPCGSPLFKTYPSFVTLCFFQRQIFLTGAFSNDLKGVDMKDFSEVRPPFLPTSLASSFIPLQCEFRSDGPVRN